MVTVHLTHHLYSFFPHLEGKDIAVEASTVADVVRALEALAPGIGFYIRCDSLEISRSGSMGWGGMVLARSSQHSSVPARSQAEVDPA